MTAFSCHSNRSLAGILSVALLLPVFQLLTLTRAQAQTGLWSEVSLRSLPESTDLTPQLPSLDKGMLLQLNVQAMQARCATAPAEFTRSNTDAGVIELPLPDGSFQTFQILESPLMEPALAARYPDIKTYLLKGIDDPLARGRLSVSPDECGAYFTSHQFDQEVMIRKAFKDDPFTYLTYWAKDHPEQTVSCMRENTLDKRENAERLLNAGPNETGDVLRVFRLAMTIPGAVSEASGWDTKTKAMSALIAFLGQLNHIYERDLAVRFVLPEEQDKLIFVDADTDPFTATGGGEAANENLMVINQLIGLEGYDVGLIFVTGGCCAAGKPVVCSDYKAWNFSAFWSLTVTAHEIGHQLDADHTWTSCGPSNNGQFGTNEYGSGTTIMSYSGLCGVDNIEPTGDRDYFGVYSQIQMTNHILARTCYKTLETGNHIPVSTIPAGGFYIPVSTPFELVGSATDEDGDQLTYSWEQTNIRNIDFTSSTISIQTPPTPADGNVPITRLFNPVASPVRTIPQLADLLSNTSTVYERLPTYSRNLKYRMYVRDNHPGAGGTTHQELSFEVDGTAGPFLVTAPNTCVSWQAGSSQTITWDVANTTNNLVNCQEVKISLSLDGGYNYAYVLAAATPNDGSETITLPAGICSNKSRIKIEAVGNIFFDISNENFSIEENGGSVVKSVALQLDNPGERVQVQNASLGNFGTNDFTMEMWIKTTNQNAALISKRGICNCDNFWNLFLDQGRLIVEFSTSGNCDNYFYYMTNDNTLGNGNWRHIALARQNGILSVYIDGLLQNTLGSSQNFDNQTPINIGNNICGQNFTGNMDEIRIWSIARSAAEINANKNCSLTGNEPGLLAYYDILLQDCGGCSENAFQYTDKTPNANHGILQNGAGFSLSTADIDQCSGCVYGSFTIDQFPVAQSVFAGDTATFFLSATGDNLSYQWYQSLDGGQTFTEINGATAPVYKVKAVASQSGRLFTCYVSNACTLEQTAPVSLTLFCGTPALSSITGPAEPCVNNYFTYFVAPNPDIANWSWTAPADWQVSVTGNMLFVKAGQLAGNISVSGTDFCGQITPVQTLAVSPVLVGITAQPVSLSVLQDQPATFNVAVSGGLNTTYQWQESTNGGISFANIAGANADTYTLPAALLDHDGRLFRCICTNNCLVDTTEVAALEVTCTTSAPAMPADIAGGLAICQDASVYYSITPVPGADSYQWALPQGWTGASTGLEILATAGSTGGAIRVRAVNGCGISEEQILPVSVKSDPCKRAIHFDGDDDHLAIAQNGQELNGDLTISFWIKPDVLPGDQTLIYNGREFIVLLSNGRIRYKHSDNCCGYDNVVDFHFSGILETTAWQHVSIIRSVSNRTVDFYLNGVWKEQRTYETYQAPPGKSDVDMIIGAGKNGEWLPYKGALDEIKLWNVTTSAEDLLQEVLCEPLGDEPGLMAYYSFEFGQPYGDNQNIQVFSNAATAYGEAQIRNLAMKGVASNVVSGDQPPIGFMDEDADGYGGAAVGCGFEGTIVTNALDCDDANAAVNPGVLDLCNGLDDDCNGQIDDLQYTFTGSGLPTTIGDIGTFTSTRLVNVPITEILDINLLRLNITHTWTADLVVVLRSPNGTEVQLLQGLCGDKDDILLNFDDDAVADYGQIPCPATDNGWYKPQFPLAAFNGENPNGIWTLTATDVEAPDAGTLNDWAIDFPEPSFAWYSDADGDGFGNPALVVQSPCSLPGFVANNLDCDDTNAAINPAAEDVLNGLDDDCDSMIDDSISVGVLDQWAEVRFALMPNPADKYLDLILSGEKNAVGSVVLINQAGQVVLSQQVTIAPGGQVRLGIEQLPQGMYYVRLIREDGVSGGEAFVLQRG
ncbi:MAG TPA: LamG-like jellyroll fold domain-containing protein [Saprospiraceae bacterium]|nr:LamG-like jellyroll fold domain-containing protein [Saprospiraceae bacterium]